MSVMRTLPTNYERGRSAEYHVKRLLEAQGYQWIIRSAASHTPSDLLASNGAEILMVQVKAGPRGRLNKKELFDLLGWAEVFHVTPVLARKKGGRWVLSRLT